MSGGLWRELDTERPRWLYILNIGLLGAFALVLPYFLLSLLGRLSSPPFTKDVDVLISLGCLAILASAYGLLRWGKFRASGVLIILLGVFVPSLYFFLYQDTNSPAVILYAVPIVVAGLLLGVRGSTTVAVLVSLVYIGLSWYAHLVIGQPLWPLNWVAVAGAAGLIVLSVYFYVWETDRALNRLLDQAEDLRAADEEKSRLVDDLQALTTQQRTLLDLVGELAAPVIPVQSGVIVLPLIGHVDEARAERVMAALLEGIAAHRARVAVVDVTGLATVDALTAQLLVKMAQGARLLGATCVLSGLRADAARHLVHLDVKLDALVTCADVQSGIEYARRQIPTDNTAEQERAWL